ncbi:hypothetical protein MTO96_003964 [Rhipicephalus appendiculatus]
MIGDELIRSTEDEHGYSPLEVDSESSNSGEGNVESSDAEREDAPSGNYSDNLETADPERQGIKTDRSNTSEGDNSDGLETARSGWSATESAENKAAPLSTKDVAGHDKPKLEETQASCTGSGVLAGNAPAGSQVDKFGSMSDQSSDASSRGTGSASSFGSDCVALIVDSVSDDEVFPENVEWSPTESGENEAASPSTKEVAGHNKPKLEEGHASCTGTGVLSGNALAGSQVDKFGSMSDQSSDASSPGTGSASSFGSDCVALIVDSISDDEVFPENVE